MRGNALEMEAILQRSIKHSLNVTDKIPAARAVRHEGKGKDQTRHPSLVFAFLCTLYNSIPSGIISRYSYNYTPRKYTNN